MTTRGFGTAEAVKVGHLIADVLDAPDDESRLAAVRAQVAGLTARFPVYR
jgi:glycine hydroxymethyltransferase